MRRGEDLVAKDLITGKSDPYVKFKCAGQKVRRRAQMHMHAHAYNTNVHVHVHAHVLISTLRPIALRPIPACCKVKTKVAKGSLNPNFNETLQMNVDDPEEPILVEVKDWNFASNISMGKATISNPQPQPCPYPSPSPNPILTLTLSLALTLALIVTRQGQDLPQRVQGHGGQGDAPRPRERQPRRHTRQCDMVPALVVSVGALQTSLYFSVQDTAVRA